MKENKYGIRRALAILLCVLLVTSNLGVAAFAEGDLSAPAETQTEQQEAESNTPPAANETQQQEAENNDPPAANETQQQETENNDPPAANETQQQETESNTPPAANETQQQETENNTPPAANETQQQETENNDPPAANETQQQETENNDPPVTNETQQQETENNTPPAANETQQQEAENNDPPAANETQQQEALPFQQDLDVGEYKFSIKADAGVFPADASLSIQKITDEGLARKAEDALGVSPSEKVLVRHVLFSFAGPKMSGSAEATVKRIGLVGLGEAYPDAQISAYLLRWNGAEQRMESKSANFDQERDRVRFSFSDLTIYDLVMVLRLPEKKAEETAAATVEEPQPTDEQQPTEDQQSTEEEQTTEEQPPTEEEQTTEEQQQLTEEEQTTEEQQQPTEEEHFTEEQDPTEEEYSAEEQDPTEEEHSTEEEQQPTEEEKSTEEQPSTEEEQQPTEEEQTAEEQQPTEEQPSTEERQQPTEEKQPAKEQPSAEKQQQPTEEDAQPTGEQPNEEEPEAVPFKQVSTVNNIRLTITANAGVFAPEAKVSVERVNSQELSRLAEQALGIASDSYEIIFHYIFRFSGAEMDGSGKVKLEKLLLSDLAAMHRDSEAAVYAVRFGASEQQAQEIKCNYSIEKNGAAFPLSGMGAYDVVFVIRKAAPAAAEVPAADDAAQENGEEAETEEPTVPDEKEKPTKEEEPAKGENDAKGGEPAKEEEPAKGENNAKGGEPTKEEEPTEGENDAKGGEPNDDGETDENGEGSGDDAAETTMQTTEAETVVETYTPESDGRSNDELLTGYVNNLFSTIGARRRLLKSSGVSVGASLEGKALTVYNELKAMVAEVAAGNRTSTVYTQQLEFGPWTSEDLGGVAILSNGSLSQQAKDAAQGKAMQEINTSKVLSALLADCPYEMYWYDKTSSLRISYSVSYSYDTTPSISCTLTLTLEMPVVTAYRGSADYTVNATLAQHAAQAVDGINTILNSAPSDVNKKLEHYKNEICNRVSYNTAAADPNNNTPYGNPWQLVWVFDNDDTTNVVCEGYSKAFKYLCDKSGITCLLVSGNMSGGTGAGGGHMWNLVTLEDRTYLVDVTNCDAGSIGYPDKLFMKMRNRNDSWYKYTISGVTYEYSDNTKTTFGEPLLTVYAPAVAHEGNWDTNLRWVLDENGLLTISGEGAMTALNNAADAWRAYSGDIQSVVIEQGVTSIGDNAFNGCANLTSVTIPDGVTGIGDNAFSGCTSLADVYFDGTQAEWTSINTGTNSGLPNATTVHFNKLTVYLYPNANPSSYGYSFVTRGNSYPLPACSFTAPAGKVFKEWSVVIGDAEAVPMAPGEEITVTADTIATAVWEDTEDEPTFTTHALLLAGEIGVVFRVHFPDGFDPTGCYVSFVATDGRSSTMQYANAETVTDSNDRDFTCDINALELAETITATLHYGDGQTATNDFSAMQYITVIQNNASTYANELPLVNALQAYGYYMQHSGWTDDKASHTAIPQPANTPDIAAAKAAVSNMQIVKTMEGSGIADSKVALVLNAKTVITVSVKPEDNVTISSTGYKIITINGDTYYEFSTTKIGPKALATEYTVSVTTSVGTAIVQTSAMAYVNALFGTGLTENQQRAMAAYYEYYLAATNY